MIKKIFILFLFLFLIGNAFAWTFNPITPNASNSFYDDINHYYNFEDNVLDQIGAVNGSASNLTYSTGLVGKTGVFNGTSSWVSISGATSSYNNTTISLLFQTDNNTSNRTLFERGVTSGCDPSSNNIMILSDGNLSTNIGCGIPIKTPINVNEIYHVVMTINNSNLTSMYVNGEAIEIDFDTRAGQSTSIGNDRIGRSTNTGNNFWFDGNIDEVIIIEGIISEANLNDLINFYDLGITADFNYKLLNSQGDLNLINNSSISGAFEIDDINWFLDDTQIGTGQSFVYESILPNTDYNFGMFVDSNVLDVNDWYYEVVNISNGLSFNFFDENSLGELDGVTYTISPSINGVSSGTLTDNNLDLNIIGITSQEYTFTFTKTGYESTSFKLNLNQFSDINYLVGLVSENNSILVNFQVYNESGSFAENKNFFAYDFGQELFLGTKTTDSLGRMSFYLNKTKSDYNFFSTDFNFGTTIWTINKPKSATTLNDIAENWQYSITGASYSSGYNLSSGITKLLLQNTANPYYIKISDINGVYAETTFGLQSITGEETKTLTPYIYPFGSASLKLIKLIDFATNQPIASANELDLFLYTDSNGLIQIGTFINDSTGTYNIYMDANELYKLNIGLDSFELRPTLDIYYLYLTSSIGIDINGTYNDVNTSGLTDFNLPPIFLEAREFMFGCSQSQDTCYGSIIFSLIAIVLLSVVFFSLSGGLPIVQSILTGFLLSIFTVIGFVPLWLFGVGIVILIAWGVFG